MKLSHYAILFATLLFTGGVEREAAAAEEGRNKVAIIIDSSGSYATRRQAAMDRAAVLLEGMASVEIERWQTSHDEVYLISLDAMPEVIWQGTLPQLKAKALDESYWKARFDSRTDYRACTDVGEAFRVAAGVLEGDSRTTGKYLFVFSDLIDEPPLSSIRGCASPKHPSAPPAGMPWDNLRDCSVSIFWLPAEQKYAWRNAIREQKLEESFRLYTESESDEVSIAPPPRKDVVLTEGEKEAQRAEIVRKTNAVTNAAFQRAKTLMSVAAKLGALLLALIVLLAGVLLAFKTWRRSRRSASSRPQPPSGGAHQIHSQQTARRDTNGASTRVG